MKKTMKRLIAAPVLFALVLGLMACNNTGTTAADDIVNGSFEDVSSGEWVGWTRKDAAFNFRGVTDVEKVKGVTIEKSGTYYFSGTAGANPPMRGTLTSDVFKLGGNGFISFKMGGGKDTSKVYVEFFEDGKTEAIARVANEDCDGTYITEHLITKVVDLSAYVGKNIYIVVTDNDDGTDLSYVNLDDFRVLKTDEEVAAARAEYARQIEEYGEKPFEEDPTASTIVNGGFETGDLTGWKLLSGSGLTVANVTPTSQYYWTDRSVYGEGEYYIDGVNNGAISEDATGAIRSTKFTLGGDGFITFMIGSGATGDYVAVCDGETDEELIKVTNEYFSDPGLALTLLRVYVDASEYMGRVLYMKVVDQSDAETSGGFRFINVDDFRVSLTKEEVAALEVEQIEKIKSETYTSASYDDLTTLLNYYNKYPYPVPLASLAFATYAENVVRKVGDTFDVRTLIEGASATYGEESVPVSVTKVTFGENVATEGFENPITLREAGFYTVYYGAEYEGSTVEASITIVALADDKEIANGGFESGNLAGWTILTEGWGSVQGQPIGVISATTYWGEELPYNQAGDYHLDGWNTGIGEADPWAIRSTNFTLQGSGFISLKMGAAAAAVKVYKADGTLVGYYKQNRFSDANFPHVSQGGSWADMGTYVIDLSAYLGQELYLELIDEKIDGGWAHAFFDDIVCYYATAPDYANLADTVMDGHTADETPVEFQIPWQLAENLL